MPKNILQNKFIIFLLLFTLIQPDYFRSFKQAEIIYAGLTILSGFLLFIYFIQIKESGRISKTIFLICVYSAYIFAVTAITNGNVFNAARLLFFSLLLCVIYNELIHNDKESFIEISNIIFEILIYANLVTILLFPGGIYETFRVVLNVHGNFILRANVNPHFLLGHRNNVIFYILPALAFSFTRSYLVYNKIRSRAVLLFLASWTTVLLTWSANSIVAMFVVTVCLLFTNRENSKIKIINAYTGFFFSVIFFVTIVVFRLQYMFSWFIETLLNKSLTMTGRGDLWNNTFNSIGNNLIFGHGYNSHVQRVIDIGHMNSAHNIYLDLLYRGGIIQLFLFLCITLYIMKKMKKEKDKFSYNIFSVILTGYFVVLSATPLADFHFSLFLGFLILCDNIELINKEPSCPLLKRTSSTKASISS